MPFQGRCPYASSYSAHAETPIKSSMHTRRIALVEVLTIGSRCGSASFLTRDSIGSGMFDKTSFEIPSPFGRGSIDKLPQTLNHGVTQTYLIVKTSRRKSFTGIASKTLTAKN